MSEKIFCPSNRMERDKEDVVDDIREDYVRKMSKVYEKEFYEEIFYGEFCHNDVKKEVSDYSDKVWELTEIFNDVLSFLIENRIILCSGYMIRSNNEEGIHIYNPKNDTRIEIMNLFTQDILEYGKGDIKRIVDSSKETYRAKLKELLDILHQYKDYLSVDFCSMVSANDIPDRYQFGEGSYKEDYYISYTASKSIKGFHILSGHYKNNKQALSNLCSDVGNYEKIWVEMLSSNNYDSYKEYVINNRQKSENLVFHKEHICEVLEDVGGQLVVGNWIISKIIEKIETDFKEVLAPLKI